MVGGLGERTAVELPARSNPNLIPLTAATALTLWQKQGSEGARGGERDGGGWGGTLCQLDDLVHHALIVRPAAVRIDGP